MHSSLKILLLLLISVLQLTTRPVIECLRVVEHQNAKPTNIQLDKSRWHTIEFSSTNLEGETSNEECEVCTYGSVEGGSRGVRDVDLNQQPSPQTLNSTRSIRSKKLIEWDDDELNDLASGGKLQQDRESQRFSSLITVAPEGAQSASSKAKLKPKTEKTSRARLNKSREPILLAQSLENKPQVRLETDSIRKKSPALSSSKKFSKLIYHGHVDEKDAVKDIEGGLRLRINTYKPVTINRRSFPMVGKSLTESGTGEWRSARDLGHQAEDRRLSTDTRSGAQEEPNVADSLRSTLSSRERRSKQEEQSLKAVKYQGSEWKPIVVNNARSRRSRLQKVETKAASDQRSDGLRIEKLENFKWKPITNAVVKDDEKSRSHLLDGDINEKKTVLTSERSVSSGSNIEEPFDDDGLSVLRKGEQEREVEPSEQPQVSEQRLREPKAISRSRKLKEWQEGSRWMPVDTTTQKQETIYDEEVITSTSAALPETTTLSTTPNSANSTHNGTELAQKSASDLNYIYSSQPITTNSQQQAAASGSYYSNYIIQPQPQPQSPTIAQLSGTVIDTTSGQTPEMVLDRTPEQPSAPIVESISPGIGGAYSLPQTSASFQPAPTPPIRQPTSVYGNGYDYYATQPIRQQQQQLPVTQTTRQQAPAGQPQNQVVKQEHHYHYYNQPTRQQPEAQNERQFQPTGSQPTQQIIREIQPLLISQPIVQTPSTTTTTTTTTTPAPQIIREIIRETSSDSQTMPLTPLQVSRLMLPPAVSLTPQPVREVENGLNFYASAASAPQRIIRQISNSLPTVSLQMPFPIRGLPQIRLPVPTIQMPARLASGGGVTGNAPVAGSVTRQTGSFVIPPMPKKTTTFLTETQAMPTHTTIMHTTQFTRATRTTVYTTDHQTPQTFSAPVNAPGYRK